LHDTLGGKSCHLLILRHSPPYRQSVAKTNGELQGIEKTNIRPLGDEMMRLPTEK
jgi:hypothetical protein